MFNSYSAGAVVCLAALLIGCQGATDSETAATTSGTLSRDVSPEFSKLTLVSLSVPKMC